MKHQPAPAQRGLIEIVRFGDILGVRWISCCACCAPRLLWRGFSKSEAQRQAEGWAIALALPVIDRERLH